MSQMNTPNTASSKLPRQRTAAWLVHLLTSLSAIFALLTVQAILAHQDMLAFFWMGAAIFVDAIDGTLARKAQVLVYAPKIDGALLDNIVDYLNYVFTPAIFLLVHPTVLPRTGRIFILSVMLLCAAFQFTQQDAKTKDNFFKGFPCYWNFVAFYMVIFGTPAWFNATALLVFCVLVFVPIKYIYLSRMEYLTHNPLLRHALMGLSVLYGLISTSFLFLYPNLPKGLIIYSVAYLLLYFGLSVFRTLRPIR